jgi:hypothetical protein
VPFDEFERKIADRPAQLAARGHGRLEVHATPDA